MIKKLNLQNRFLDCTLDDRNIITQYIESVNKKNPFTTCTFQMQCQAIELLLNDKELTELNDRNVFFENNFLSEKQTKHSKLRKYVYDFIIYLCEHNLIPLSPLYRILEIKDILYPANIQSLNGIRSFFSLDNRFINAFRNIYDDKTINNRKKRYYLFLNLDESIFSDKRLFNIMNESFLNFKFQVSKKTNHTKMSNLITYRRIITDLVEVYGPEISLPQFLNLFEQWNKIQFLLIKISLILYDYKFFSTSSVNQYLYLIKGMEKTNTKYVFPVLEKLISTKNLEYWFIDRYNNLRYCNCIDSDKHMALKKYSEIYKLSNTGWPCFLDNFDNSLNNPLAPLSFYTYLEQIKYFKTLKFSDNKKKQESYYNSIFSIIHSFYTFYQINYDSKLFDKDGYSTTLLTQGGIAHYIAKGFEVINYNQNDHVPTSDKWIICSKISKSSDSININTINFSKVQNTSFREWLKLYTWKTNSLMKTKIIEVAVLTKAFNYIELLKKGSVKSYFVTHTSSKDNINLQEVRAYKNYILGSLYSDRTKENYLSILRNILSFISINTTHEFEKGIFIELKNISYRTMKNSPKVIPMKELEIISEKIGFLAKDNPIYKLYYLIFYLLLETEFRFTQIVNLSVDCVKVTSKRNEYIIYSETKTSNQDKIEQPITLYTKKCIDEVLRITSEYRTYNTNTELNSLLFIFPSKLKKNTFTKLKNSNYNVFLKKVCKSLDLETIYTVSNLRDTHMTMAENHIIKQHLSDTQLSILTSHSSSSTTIKHYARPDIVEMLETTNGVIIGDIDLNGNILKKIPKNIEKSENLVSDNCGYCSANNCQIFSDLSCMLCKDFVTTISRKPYFEEQLKLIDVLMEIKTLPHDKEDLINRKRLILSYIEAIMELEKEDWSENK